MARSLPKVCPFLVTVDLKLKWPELPRPTLFIVPIMHNYIVSLQSTKMPREPILHETEK